MIDIFCLRCTHEIFQWYFNDIFRCSFFVDKNLNKWIVPIIPLRTLIFPWIISTIPFFKLWSTGFPANLLNWILEFELSFCCHFFLLTLFSFRCLWNFFSLVLAWVLHRYHVELVMLCTYTQRINCLSLYHKTQNTEVINLSAIRKWSCTTQNLTAPFGRLWGNFQCDFSMFNDLIHSFYPLKMFER